MALAATLAAALASPSTADATPGVLDLLTSNNPPPPRYLVAPTFRLGIGPSVRLAPPETLPVVDVALDVSAGVNAVFGGLARMGDGFVLNPEVGYSYDARGLHAFHLKAGVGLSYLGLVGGMYVPRLLAGTWHGPAVGMRNSFELKMPWDLASLEVGHQFVVDDSGLQQQAVVFVTVNPGTLAYVVFRTRI
jgi:hypothetical protein